jgi:glycerol-3-phosphate dehydrogenase
MLARFTILGDGAWGTTIAILLSRRPDHRVVLWSARAEHGRRLQAARENTIFLLACRFRRRYALPSTLVKPSILRIW